MCRPVTQFFQKKLEYPDCPEKFADEDAKLKGKVEARNELESYAYSLKNQLSDKEKLGGKLSDEETAKIEEVRTLLFQFISRSIKMC